LWPLQENRTIVPSPIFDLYRVSLPLVQIIAFVPDGATVRYQWPLTTTSRPPPTQPVQMPHICTGPCLGPVQMCNGYNCFFLPLPKPPPHYFSSSLNANSPSPMTPKRSFARFMMISSRIHSLKWCRC
jgi:hypothetical protein